MDKIFAKKTEWAFGQIVFIITAVFSMVAFISFGIFQKVYLYLGLLIHRIQTACNCAQMTQLISMHPIIFAAAVFFGLTILAFIGYLFYQLFRLISRTQKFIKYYLSFAQPGRSFKLRQTLNALDLDKQRVVEIGYSAPMVFCFGFWRPRICISSTLVGILDKNELRAVLMHESRHMVSGEPLKLFIAKYFQSVFSFIPGVKTYVRKYFIYSELAADEEATKNEGGRVKLAGAILKILQHDGGGARLLAANLAVSFFGSAVVERANRLADSSYVPKFKLLDRDFIVSSLAVLFMVSSALVFLSDASKAFAMHNMSGCDSSMSMDTSYAAAKSGQNMSIKTDDKCQHDLACKMN